MSSVDNRIALRITMASNQRPGFVHAVGTEGFLVEELGPDAWLAELRQPDESLVGDLWFETVELYTNEFEETAFVPTLPSHWKHVIGEVPIPPDDLRTWDEDIYSAEWRPNADTPAGSGWWIWLDGGKGLSTWQCSLVEPGNVGPDGGLLHNHVYLMRDFVETPEEVQAWIDRAVALAHKAQEQDDEREGEPA